ncbi:MAG: hypothetical protein EOP85_11405 [Verrucomicrobiaceae bacterium]|nr:MAG: hypothetical protein EOP85_11405 [Verrucomicrobiaceae bacterium]
MTPRWHRSRSLWFGLAGLVALVGAFLIYGRTAASMDWSNRNGLYGISKQWDTVALYRFDFRHPGHGAMPIPRPGFRFGKYNSPTHTVDLFTARPFKFQNDGMLMSIEVAQWLILVIYTAIWLSGTIWWLWRKHRLIRATTEGNPPEIARHPRD